MTDESEIRLRRISRGMSQAMLAYSCGFSQQLMSKIERGLIGLTPERASVLAGVLDCEPEDLVQGTPVARTHEGIDEVELLRLYRKMNPYHRRTLLQIAHMFMIDGYPPIQLAEAC